MNTRIFFTFCSLQLCICSLAVTPNALTQWVQDFSLRQRKQHWNIYLTKCSANKMYALQYIFSVLMIMSSHSRWMQTIWESAANSNATLGCFGILLTIFLLAETHCFFHKLLSFQPLLSMWGGGSQCVLSAFTSFISPSCNWFVYCRQHFKKFCGEELW